MVKGVHWGKSQQSLLEFPNSLILPNVHMGISLITHLKICPGYLLGVGDGGGVRLEQFYKTIYWFLRSSWAIFTSFVYLCLLLWNYVGYLYSYHHKFCVSLLFLLVFGHFSKILKGTDVKKRHLQIKKGTVLMLLFICSLYKKATLHTRFCMMNDF